MIQLPFTKPVVLSNYLTSEQHGYWLVISVMSSVSREKNPDFVAKTVLVFSSSANFAYHCLRPTTCKFTCNLGIRKHFSLFSGIRLYVLLRGVATSTGSAYDWLRNIVIRVGCPVPLRIWFRLRRLDLLGVIPS